METHAAPLISVVIPTRDAAASIDDCLRSLAGQSFEDFDVWILDGGSADNTADLARPYAGKVGHTLHVRVEADRGPYEAMNKGITLSRGQWLYFMGADDRLHDPDVLADVAAQLRDVTPDMLYGDVINRSTGNRYGGEWSLDRLLFEANICHQAVFYRRSLFERVGGFSLRYPIWADWDLNIRCFRHPGLSIRWVDRLVAEYNDRAGLSRGEDPVFRKELPRTILRDAKRRCAWPAGWVHWLGGLLAGRGRN
ncbi:MAG: glycosyltransferase [Thiobacillus sp.]|nr:glycosyltransferase [Thiobacillus sp.]